MKVTKLFGLVLALTMVIALTVASVQAGRLENGTGSSGQEPELPTVLFADDLPGRVSLVGFGAVEMNVELPAEVSSGTVTVVTDEGISNPMTMTVGTPAVPDLSSIAATWSATVSGNVTEDTVWSESTLLSGTVTVEPGVILTITPGVTIFGDPEAKLLIAGALVAEGTPAAPIYFTSSAADPAPGAWTGIHVTKNGHLSLKDALVQYAQQAVDFRTDMEGAAYLSGTVSHCTLQHNEHGLRTLASPSAYPDGGNVTVQVTVTHNYVSSNTIAGLSLRTSAGYRRVRNHSLVEHNRFEENATGIHVQSNSWWVGHTENRPVIRNNAIRNSHDYGIDIRGYGSSDGTSSDTQVYPTVEHNLLESNPTGLRLYLIPRNNKGTKVIDAVVRYNTFRHSAHGIRMQHTQNYGTLTATIEHNVFYGFDEAEAYAIDNPTGRHLDADDNYWGVDKEAWAQGAAGMTSGTVTVKTFLTADDPPVLTHLAPGSGQAGDTVSLHGANFGEDLLKPHVIFTDDLLGRIDFDGMNTVEMKAELPPNVITGAVHVVTQQGVSNPAALEVEDPAVPDLSDIAATWSTTASGTVTEDTVWSESTLLSGTITVQPGVVLTITPGVTLFGGTDAELVIAGALVAEGTPAAPIYFTSSAADPAPGAWIGIRVTKESHAFSLRYALVQYAQQGVYFLASTEGAAFLSGTLSHCTLQHNEYGLQVYTRPDADPYNQTATAQVTMTHSYVYSNTVAGARLQTSAGGGWASSYSLLEHNRFEENPTGIYVSANSWWIGHTDNRPIIRNNAIRNNHDYGIDIRGYGSSDGTSSDTQLYPTIEHNLLEGNSTGLRLYLIPRNEKGTKILDATVRYNTFRHSAYGIRMEHTQSYGTLTAAIEHNVFYGFDEAEAYAIANPTGRPLSADDNYWGADEEAWAQGAAGMTSGTVTVKTFLTADDPPVLTHLAPGSEQAGGWITLHGANFGKVPYSVRLQPTTVNGGGNPGDSVTYTLSLQNTGSVTDTFEITGISSKAWAMTYPSSIGPLAASGSAPVAITVQIPAGANDGDFDYVTLTATSQHDGRISAISVLMTTAYVAPINRGVTLSPHSAAASGDPGATVTYTLLVTNTGDVADTIDLSHEAPGGWTVSYSTNPLNLGSGAGQEVEVYVSIPLDAEPGAMETITITATSQADVTADDQATLLTTVNLDLQQIYLPLVVRNHTP